MARDKSFQDRFYSEYDLKGRVRLSLILSIIFYPGFLILDAIYTPRYIGLFTLIRIIVIILNALLLIAHKYAKSVRRLLNIGMALLVVDALGIAIMIQIMGGFMSSYYQGLTLVIMCMMVLLPFAFKESAIASAIVWAFYFLPSLFNIQRGVLEWRIMVNNLFFLTAIVIIGTAASYVMDHIRIRALKTMIQLEDLTEQLRESNLKLKSLDELKTQFFANVSHELRTPLTLMLAPLGPMIEGQIGRISTKQKDALTTIRHNGLKLLKLINNLLDLTKLEAGKLRLRIKTLDFVDYINSLLSTVRPLADRKSLKIYFQHPSSPVMLTIDADQFEKVVLNLLSNALKFTPENGRITVYLEEKKTTVLMVVEDTGIGIPSKMLESIFNRFSQVDGSPSRHHEGTGIGLSLAKEIVQLHGGTIHAESEIGKGSRFCVEMQQGESHFSEDVIDRRVSDMPVDFKKRAADADRIRIQDIVTDFRKLQLIDLDRLEVKGRMKSHAKSHEYSLLVIDDNPEVLNLMKLLLGEEYDLNLVSSGEDGLAVMRKKMPDLVLSDVMMPEMDGHALCAQIKADSSLRHIPVMLVTARSGAEMLREGIEAGADDYISKPFDSVELKARIRSLLRMRKAEAELALISQNLKARANDLAERQRSLFLAMIRSMVSALEAKDKYTRDHSARVTEVSLRIAKAMGRDERELNDLELAAILHDIGKIAVPEKILNKQAKLTDEEFALIRQHPAVGESILQPVVELLEITKVVRHHHERYDGKGYPDGLKGQEIPLGARIMAIADTYDAITSERPYREATSHNFAVKEIVRCSGTQFDPEVIEHFIEVSKTLLDIGRDLTK